MFRDPATQLGVSLLTGQLALLHLRANRLTLSQELLAERANLRCGIGAEPARATRAETRLSTGSPASASTGSPASASACASACADGGATRSAERGASTGGQTEASGHSHAGEALGRQLLKHLPVLDTACLDTSKAVNARERSRLEPALSKGRHGGEQDGRENHELDGAHGHLLRNVGTESPRCPMDVCGGRLLRQVVHITWTTFL